VECLGVLSPLFTASIDDASDGYGGVSLSPEHVRPFRCLIYNRVARENHEIHPRVNYYRSISTERGAYGYTCGRILRNWSVHHAVAAKLLVEILHGSPDVPRTPKTLANDEHFWISFEKVFESL
jgi:hypothetical protein